MDHQVGGFSSVMKLSAFGLLLFFVSAALVMASLLGYFRDVPYLTAYRYWLALGGYGVMVLGIVFKGQSH